jgi:type III secretion protein J
MHPIHPWPPSRLDSYPSQRQRSALKHWRWWLVVTLVALSGCTQQLLGSIDEMAANQVVSALRLEGVTADKAPAGEKLWKVSVPQDQFALAVQIIERRNLPAPAFQGLGQMFKKESLVSTPTEERARLVHAMSQELERSLMEIDGVLIARVHPVILPSDPLSPKRMAASASVLIKYRSGWDMSGRESMVRALVAAGVEGLSFDDVRVVMVAAPAPTSAEPMPLKAAANANYPRWTQQLLPLYGAVLATLAGLVMLYGAWVRWQRQQKAAAPSGPLSLAGRWAQPVSGSPHEPVQKNAR